MKSVQGKNPEQGRLPKFDPSQNGIPFPRGAVRLEKELKDGRYCPPKSAQIAFSSYDDKVTVTLTYTDYEKKVAIAVAVNDARFLGCVMLFRFIGSDSVIHEEKSVLKQSSFVFKKDIPCGFPCVFAFEVTEEVAWWDQVLSPE